MTRVEEDDSIKEKFANLKETKTCTGIRVSRKSCSRWVEGILQKMLIHMVGRSADDSFADESEGEKEFGFDQGYDDSVII